MTLPTTAASGILRFDVDEKVKKERERLLLLAQQPDFFYNQ